MTSTPPQALEPFIGDDHRRYVMFFGTFPSHVRNAWSEWFRRHGIDATEVAYPGSVAADDEACFIEFQPVGSGMNIIKLRRIQLEARALPFPAT